MSNSGLGLYIYYLFAWAKKITVSTLFTFSRFILVPFVVCAILEQSWNKALGLFIIAALTDIIDGALARYLKEETVFGAYLDPLADKVLLLSCYIALVFVDSKLFIMPIWFIKILIFKEITLVISALYLVIIKRSYIVKPALLGKLNTFTQVIFLLWLFIHAWINFVPKDLFLYFLYILVALNLATLFQYSFIAYGELKLWLLKKSIK